MASLAKLKELGAESPFKNVRVNHDLTPEQRAEAKALLKEAYDKNQCNPDSRFLWKVRGPPTNQYLIKIPKNRLQSVVIQD